MSAPEPKPVRRIGLYLPFLIVAVALAAWSVWWFVLADRIGRESDRVAADLRAAGYQVSFRERTVTGWPFRAFVQWRDLRIAAPSGHAIETPRLAAEAQAYAIDTWVVAAPEGLTVTRGAKGKLRIDAKAARASLSGVGATPPNLAVQLLEPKFTPLPGAAPFPLASAGKVELYLRPKAGVPGDGEFLFLIDAGRGRRDGVLSGVTGGGGFSTRYAGTVVGASRFAGPSWAAAARRWSAAGGALTGVQGELTAGRATARATTARLDIAADGRLRGTVALELDGAPAAAAVAAGAAQGETTLGETARLTLTFAPDGTRLGPLTLAPAPKVF